MTKINISPASRRSRHIYKPTHVTTTDFGHIGVARTIEVLPGDKLSITNSNFCRFATLAKPTFGKITNNTLSVFVPYHILKYDADAFLSGNNLYNGDAVHKPVVTDAAFMYMFYVGFGGYDALAHTSLGDEDTLFADINAPGSTKRSYYVSPVGRFIYKLLQQLGYDIVNPYALESAYSLELEDEFSQTTIRLGARYSAFPLMAFFKAYNDLLSSQLLHSSSFFSRVLKLWYQGSTAVVSVPNIGTLQVGYIDTNTSSYILNPYIIRYLFEHCTLLWDDDILTEAWRYPSVPSSDGSLSTSMRYPVFVQTSPSAPSDARDVARYDKAINTNYMGPSINNNTGTASGDIAARALQLLQRFDKFITRNNYAGSLVTSQLLSRFGINIGDVKHLYAQKLDFSSEDIVIGDVTSTAATEEKALGSYAGKAVSATRGSFTFESTDYGIIIILHWLSPRVNYRGCMDASVLRDTFEDFYQPELDGMQSNPISFKEVMDFRQGNNDTSALRLLQTFGWNERYSNYRKMRSRVTGDTSLFNEFYNWALQRRVYPLGAKTTAGDVFAQSDYIIYQPILSHPCLNIFMNVSNVADHVFVYHSCDIQASRPILSTSEATGLEEGNVSLDKNGTHYN